MNIREKIKVTLCVAGAVVSKWWYSTDAFLFLITSTLDSSLADSRNGQCFYAFRKVSFALPSPTDLTVYISRGNTMNHGLGAVEHVTCVRLNPSPSFADLPNIRPRGASSIRRSDNGSHTAVYRRKAH